MAASTTKKGYEPADVRWESIAENQRNKRSNVYIDAADVRNLLTALEQGERVVCGPMRSATYGRPPTRRMSRSVGP